MIARISSGFYVKGMVQYNTSKTNSGEAKLISTNNISDNSPVGIETTIRKHNALNKRIKKPNIHISLNFHERDNLTENDLIEIAEDYMDEMGYSDQPYAVFQHFDAGHNHVHIVSSRIDINGKKIKDSFEYRKSERITEKIEKDRNLVVAKDQSTRKKVHKINDKINRYINDGKGDVLNLIDESLYHVLDRSPRNLKEFEKFLSFYNIGLHLNEETNGLTYYFYEDHYKNDGTRVHLRKGKYLNASDTTKGLTLEKLETLFDRNTNKKKVRLKNVRGRIFSIYNQLDGSKLHLKDFDTLLKRKGIQLNVLRAKTGERKGQIIGVSFTDFNTKFKYTGEEIKLKWNSLMPVIIDDKSDLKSEKEDKMVLNISPERLMNSNMMNLQEFLSEGGFIYPEQQETLRKKKKKRPGDINN